MDPQAINYSPGALQNDGSCLYPATYYNPVFIANLKSDLKEISGLHLGNSEWWAHNDSGFDPVLYSINTQNGDVLKKIELKNAANVDWEDVSSDSDNLYIGDFGNNDNDRIDLGFYRVPFQAIGSGSNQTVNENEYEFLPFSYPDQTDFSTQPEDSSTFDCEAMFYFQGRLHLFTKRRKDYTTIHYAFDLLTRQLHQLEAFNSNGLITGASVAPDGESIALVGYDLRGLPTVFCWLMWDWQSGSDLFFTGNKRRIELGSALQVGQVESIGFATNRSVLIANEKTEYNGILLVEQSIRRIDFSTWIDNMSGVEPSALADSAFRLIPNPAHDYLALSVKANAASVIETRVYDNTGYEIKRLPGLPTILDVSSWRPGCYTVTVLDESGKFSSKKVLKE